MNESQDELLVGQTPLAEAALEIFKSLIPNRQNYSAESTARLAFSYASSFVAEEDRIRKGGDIFVAGETIVEPQIEIDVWDLLANEPKVDDRGEKVTEVVRGDSSCFAANLDVNHPVNQRYWKSRVQLGLEVNSKFQHVASQYRNQLASQAG